MNLVIIKNCQVIVVINCFIFLLRVEEIWKLNACLFYNCECGRVETVGPPSSRIVFSVSLDTVSWENPLPGLGCSALMDKKEGHWSGDQVSQLITAPSQLTDSGTGWCRGFTTIPLGHNDLNSNFKEFPLSHRLSPWRIRRYQISNLPNIPARVTFWSVLRKQAFQNYNVICLFYILVI